MSWEGADKWRDEDFWPPFREEFEGASPQACEPVGTDLSTRSGVPTPSVPLQRVATNLRSIHSSVKPILLDAYCGAGGDTRGYQAAGWYVVGIDKFPQPNYCGDEFYQCDAIEALDRLASGLSLIEGDLRWHIEDFDGAHASPPCQHFTKYGNTVKDIHTRYEDLLEPTRALLVRTRLPYVIENVERSPLVDPVKLCGSMFDGAGTHDIQRHRLFETNWPLVAPGKCNHSIWAPDRYPGGRSVARGGHSKALVRKTIEIGSWDIPLETQKWAMGIDWDITIRELSEAIPPAYTEYVGLQLRAQLVSTVRLTAVAA